MLQEIIKIAKSAGEIALSADAHRSFSTKEGRANFVTEYDLRVQNYLIRHLSALLPQAGFICEESDAAENKSGYDYTFIIDPIDGTTNFIRNNPMFAVCIALVKGNSPVCAVVHIPALNTTYFAEAGKGAYVTRNDVTRSICVSGRSLDSAIIALGTSPYNDELIHRSFQLSKKLMSRAADVRRSGSAAIDICYVAEGIFDVMFEHKLSLWDFAAAGIILSEAGGCFSDFYGSRISDGITTSFICGTPTAYTEALEFTKAVKP